MTGPRLVCGHAASDRGWRELGGLRPGQAWCPVCFDWRDLAFAPTTLYDQDADT